MPKIFTIRGHVALVSPEDAELAALRWSSAMPGKNRYFKRNTPKGQSGSILLHRVVAERMGLALPPGALVDHINGDSTDNRRENIRVVSRAVNARNVDGPPVTSTSGFMGVSFDRSRGRWESYIWMDGVKKHLGRYRSKDEANAARLKAEKELWGIEPRREAAHA